MADLPNIEKGRVIIEDGETGTDLKINSDGSLNISGQLAPEEASQVTVEGSLTTTATTANQQIITYTVTTGKTLFLQFIYAEGRRTSMPGNANPLELGTMSLETPSGTKIVTMARVHPPANNYPAPLLLRVLSGTVIRVVVTPFDTTSTLWRACIGGYEV